MRGTIVSAAHSLKPTMVNERTGHNGGVAEQMTAINPDLLHFSELVNGCMEMLKRRCSDSQWKKTQALRGEVDSRGVKGEEMEDGNGFSTDRHGGITKSYLTLRALWRGPGV